MKRTLLVPGVAGWVVLALTASCSTTRNFEFCCTSAEDCSAFGVDDTQRECEAGFVCHENIHTCIAEGCGNAVIDGDEVCDDGNNDDGDGCGAKCTAADCFVPVTHPTIQAALMDASCAAVTVYSGTYFENVVIDRDVSIFGVGADPVVIDGQARDSAVTISSGTVSIENLTITNGHAANGGGIANHGVLTLRRARVEANTAGERGGGMYNDGGALTLESATIAGNHVVPIGTRAAGGGIYNAAGSVTITGGSIASNTIKPATAVLGIVAAGAGLASDAGEVTLVDTTVMANSIEVDGHPDDATAVGGGIHVATGSLALTRATIASNTIRALGRRPQSVGGGLVAPRVIAIESHVSDNSARAFGEDNCIARAGGFYVTGDLDSIFYLSTITGNSAEITIGIEGGEVTGGGGTLAGAGDLTLEQTSISSNTLRGTGLEVTAQGGGLYWSPDQNSTFGKLTVFRSTISSNSVLAYSGFGGGIAASLRSVGHSLKVVQSTVSGNVLDTAEDAHGGGLSIMASGSTQPNLVAVTSSTLSGNVVRTARSTGTTSGSAFSSTNLVPNGLRVHLSSCTVTGNLAEGAQNGDGAFALKGSIISTVKNAIIAGNSGLGFDCSPGFHSGGYNLVGDAAVCNITGVVANNKIGVPASLEMLADNGGPTLTHALLAGSAAQDSGDALGCMDEEGTLLLEDQRGKPRFVGGRCDIGAYER